MTDADREAANALREILADISGFWHRAGDDSPLCQAMARHRMEAEHRLADKLAPFVTVPPPAKAAPAYEQTVRSVQQEMISLPRFHGPVLAHAHRGIKS
ncbi:hypothetical protein KRR38_30065 [Novosphingobium sp. G106]|uniref:hypothetical protein n=1 Tax=Novosphingobium sp. G106 TaxID=2849500 RepID=UPI001C2D9284|nr:hypothetical protein [Novosphingobium sp. G106]MBV1686124.1 hypothetical protein [Novosphingobium sp. G106]MBV1691810.1 hypothetical protein [Novosphingobium sp. G106]